MKKLVMGNEAIALAALHAGVSVVCGYPGTPSTEVLETIAKQKDQSVYVEWSVNEKVAMEVGAGASYTGARVLITMKQVGLNVASDPLMSLSYIGVKGGVVILVADDPGPISSQTEQDTRRFGQFSKLPVFDPSTPEEAYQMTLSAFDLSEQFGIPVFLRPTTRVCHACATVDVLETKQEHSIEGFIKDPKWVIFPPLSYRNHIKLEAISKELRDVFSESPYNTVSSANPAKKVIVASGTSYFYAKEAANLLATDIKFVKVGCAVPSPEKFLQKALEGAEEILVAEELDPVLEDSLSTLQAKYDFHFQIYGKHSAHLPYAGEYSVEILKQAIAKFVGIDLCESEKAESPTLPIRPPVLCAGCPHRASFYAVKKAMQGKKSVFSGDIGCYTLGNAKPLDMVDTCLCMGAGITIAQGLHHVEPDTNHFAFIGDSTFFHSGITGLINAVYNQANVTIVILDNSTTAMTGHQPHPGTGKTMMNQVVERVHIPELVKACGVKQMEIVNPLDLSAAIQAVQTAAAYDGVSVILFQSPCVAIFKPTRTMKIIDTCITCKKCIREIGCPAITMVNEKVTIDSSLCYGCGLCTQICPVGAITNEK